MPRQKSPKVKRPIGCTHEPPCVHRRACKKYRHVTDRELASAMMALDYAVSGMKGLQANLRILAACPTDLLKPADLRDYRQFRIASLEMIWKLLKVSARIMLESTQPETKSWAQVSRSRPMVH